MSKRRMTMKYLDHLAVIISWTCFTMGVFVTDPLAKLSLLAIARVLP